MSDDEKLGKVMQRSFNTIIDTPGQKYQFAQASGLVMSLFRHHKTLDGVEKATKAIEKALMSVAEELTVSHFELIPRNDYWSADLGRAVTREQVLTWAGRQTDEPDGDRFWVGPKACIGIARMMTATGSAWMMTVYRDSVCIASQQTSSAFEMMVFFEHWSSELRQ